MIPNKECPNCQRLQADLEAIRAQLTKAQERIAALEAEVRRGHRQAAPFSRDKSKPAPKAPGRRQGQGRFSRQQMPPEEAVQQTVVVPLEACPDCGSPLQERATHQQVQVDLPKVEPAITRFVTESGYCPGCRKRVHSRHPQQVSTATGAAGVSVGPRAKALAADLKHRLGIPWRKIADLLATSFGLEVTASALCQADERLGQKAEMVYQELIEAIRGAAAVHADETGWRIGVLSSWLWVFTSQQITVYTINQRRSHEVVVEILGRQFAGVVVSDCFLAYDHKALNCWLKQKCFAHFLRELKKLEGEKTKGAVRFPRALAGVLREALALREEKPELDQASFGAKLKALEAKLDALIALSRSFTDPDNARFAKRLRKQRPHLLRFLEMEGVEATNNRAERALRPAVIVRKTGGCNKTHGGARTHAVLASILVTLKQQGREPLEYLTAVLTAPAEPPKLLASQAFDTS